MKKKPDKNNSLRKEITWSLPLWLKQKIRKFENMSFSSDKEKMSFVLDLTQENIKQKTGGPFGAAIFCQESQKLISMGVNQVFNQQNPCLHAETSAIQLACQKAQSFSLRDYGRAELFSSCEPCMMCFGATLWSGVKRLVTAAQSEDATKCGFDEGPVTKESWLYLESQGIDIRRGLERIRAQKILEEYQKDGIIYNA